MHRFLSTFAFVASLGLICAIEAAAWAESPPDFSRVVRPILSRYCFKCHGPDPDTREAGLRLDERTSATAESDSGAVAIVPGDPGASELVARITADDESLRMPPVETKMALSAEQKSILQRWIESGAEYQQHWAFVPPIQPPLPDVGDSDWPRGPIDHFTLAKMREHGHSPSEQADRYTLIRRVSLDLIGLPPTLDEVAAFLSDESPNAYERIVDRLLESPRYGERWARRWLDLARYADTNGYEKDRPRSIWPYRDWVIDALNDDMPFDQFTIEQLAGDMLPGATLDQRIATGFHRNTMLNEEGGIDPLEFRFYAMTDRVATTGTTWLGLTIACAQCHTHKYDPIPQREYYQFMALLNNADEPELDIPKPEVEAERRQRLQQIEELVGQLADKFPLETTKETAAEDSSNVGGRELAQQRFEQWLTEQRERSVRWTPLRPKEAKSNLPLLTIEDDDSVFASGDITKTDIYELRFVGLPVGVTAIRLEVLPDDRLPAHGPGMTYYEGRKGDFFLGEFQVAAGNRPVAIAAATESFGKLSIGGGSATAANTIDGDPETGWSTAGREGESSEAVFRLAAPLTADELELRMLFGRHYAASLGRFRISVTTDAKPAEARDLPPDVQSLLLVPADELNDEQQARLFRQFLLTAPELEKARREIEKLRDLPEFPTTLVMRERPPENPRPTFLHKRGEFLQPMDKVEPGVLSAVGSLPPDAALDRLALARWLVARENPLTARVIVNRAWAAFFGRGIVTTTEDFGFQGEPPSHPQLLDWLAVEFMEDGWSLKRIHKRIVMSATYRQSSRVTPELLESDPTNLWFARGARVRLEAELIRDSLLHVSGLLSPKLGGPSVFPPQPPGVTTEGTYGKLDWNVSIGDDRYRRGLYTFSKRTAPFAMFTTFDAPTGEACVARRDVSNTPLQALTLLNDAAFFEAAQALGRIYAEQTGDDETRVDELFRRVLTRPPTPVERDSLVEFCETQRQRFAAGELNAAEVAGGEHPQAAERAVWTTIARVLFNLDEAITTR